MTSAELNALAARVERLDGPDREVDALIEAALGRCGDCDLPFKVKHAHKNEFIADEDGSVTFYADDDGKMIKLARRPAPTFSASLDAAMQLVPEGYSFHLNSGTHMGATRCYLCPAGPDSGGVADPRTVEAVAPLGQFALAICAAALKARARAQEGV